MSEDRKIWETYTRGVEPAPKKRRKPLGAKAAPEKTLVRKAAEKEQPHLLRLTAPLAKDLAQPLERSRERTLRQGGLAIDAKLDLHGLTQDEAFAALAAFMRKKANAGKRHLLIITGKGRGGAGVLRRNLEIWLRRLPEADRLLALRPAAVQHGGDGAFYVVLRKKPPPAR